MITVDIHKKENFLRTLKVFKKKLTRVGVSRGVRNRRYFEKPSLGRRKERLKAIYLEQQKHKWA